MENPKPFDLNAAIGRWQENLGASPAFDAENLEELASHLRASVQRLKATGLSEEEAFLIATRRIGASGALEKEFAKVNPAVNWSWRAVLFWVASGILFVRVVSALSGAVQNYVRISTLRASHPSRFLWMLPGDYIGLVSLAALLIWWRLKTDGWKNFSASIVLRFEARARARLKLTILCSLVFALMVAILPVISGVIASRMNPPSEIRIDWANSAYRAKINVILVLGMVLLARLGLRKISPTDGALHNPA